MEVLVVLFFFAGIGFIVLTMLGLFFLAILYLQKRAKQWKELAYRHGFSYYKLDPLQIPSRYGYFPLLSIGSDRKASHVCRGAIKNWSICLFDYSYTTGSGDDETHYAMTLMILESPLIFKPMSLRPENVLDKVGAALGFDDIDFESADFSRTYCVKGENKKFTYDIIHPRMMEFLLSHKGLYIETQQNTVLFHRGCLLKAPQIEQLLQEADRFYEMIPDYVKKDNIHTG